MVGGESLLRIERVNLLKPRFNLKCFANEAARYFDVFFFDEANEENESE